MHEVSSKISGDSLRLERVLSDLEHLSETMNDI